MAAAGAGATAAQSGATDQPPAAAIAGDLNDVSIPAFEGGSPAGPKLASRGPAAPSNPGTLYPSATDAPTISVWYISNQTFGQKGDPQKWVNIVGNVGSVTPLSSLTYTLNGGAPRAISFGPNGSRLNKKGDFNIDLDYTDLATGANTVVITATDAAAGISTASVTVNYQPFAGTWTPQTYTIDFGSATQVNQVAQVVDGNWVIVGGKARPAANETGYDRLIALGDISWRDYTVTVPVTIHSIQQDKSPGVGMILRWPGHFDAGNGLQPFAGWRRLGAMAWYRYDKATSTEGLQLLGHGGNVIGTDGFTLIPGTTYLFKANVTSAANATKPATYRFKVWDATQAEPGTWDIEATGLAGEPRNGSIVLVAHHADVSFGNVVVNLDSTEPKPELTINKTGTGLGNVTANPQKATYRFGEDVTLTAVPNAGSTFAGWQGDATGAAPSTSVEMFADRKVTAVFADPTVQTPISDDFSGCALNTNLWTFINPLGDATLTLNGSQAEFAIPAGSGHDFWSSGYNSPRIMQYADNKDFEIEAKFDSSMNAKNQMQGILIAGADDKYIRYNFLHDGSSYRIQAYIFSGNDTPIAKANQTITTAAPISLRMQRVNNYWLLQYHPNAVGAWSTAVNFEFEMVVNSYGVLVGNSGNNPAFTGKVDYFFNSKSPIAPEDSSRKLTINTTGSGSVTPNPVKENYACNESVELLAVPAQGFKFNGWGGDLSGSENPKTLVMNASKSVTANFVTDVQYTITTSVVGAGQVTKSPDKPTYSPGEQVILTATASLGNLFTGWTGGASGTQNPLTVTVNSNLNIVANFATAPARTLTVTPIGNGMVDLEPDGPTYLNGQTVTLTPLPGPNGNFTGWGGDATGTENPLTIVMDSNKSITATFKDSIYTLSLLSSPTGAGTVTASPNKAAYYDGEVVSLTPVPASGQKFAGWSGDLNGNGVPGQLVMTKNSTVTATFIPDQSYTIDITINGTGSVTKNPDKLEYGFGEEVLLTPAPGPDMEFTGWSGDLTGKVNPVTITMTKDFAITANFGGIGIYALNILPSSNGTIQADPERELYAANEQVTLTALASQGFILAGWGNDLSGNENPIVLTMTGDKTVSATFVEAPLYTLNVTSSNDDQGSVAVDPPGTSFYAGTTVNLTATPVSGYVFTGWSGDVTSNVNPLPLLMDGNKTIVANFGLATTVVSDDFDGCGTLAPHWTWLDPLGQAAHELTGSQLKIVVPPNTNYEIWKDGNNGARVTQEVANTDFEIIVRFDSQLTQASQTQGILIEASENEFIRIDFYHDGQNLHFFAGTIAGGIGKNRFNQVIDLTGIPSPEPSIRVVRIGDTFRSAYRVSDDASWTGVKGSNFKQPIVVERVGVFAASPMPKQTTTAPGLTMLVDYFFNGAAPIEPEDANTPSVVVGKIGEGTVVTTPAAGPFACGQLVEVRATPAAGWRFQNFSGDLNGSTPTQSLTVSKKHTVTATFVRSRQFTLYLPMTTR